MSDEYALQRPEMLGEDFKVVSVRQRRKLGGPSLYHFVSHYALGGPGWRVREHVSDDIRPARLHLFKPNQEVVLERKTLRKQVCYTDGNFTHIVTGAAYNKVTLACGAEVKPDFRLCLPDCPKCLAARPETVWVEFIVGGYEHKADVEKAANKARAKARTRARFPMALSRVLNDWLED